MDITFFAQLVLSGILTGGIYALMALGIVLIVKASGIFNFAQGAMTALGALVVWSVSTAAIEHNLAPMPFIILATIILAFVVAFVVVQFMLRPLIGQPVIAALMLTIALGMVLSGIMNIIWPGPGRVFPPLIPTGNVTFTGIALSVGSIASFFICMVIFGLFVLFFKYTKLGMAMRGTSEDQQLSQSLGIKVTIIFMACWFITMILVTSGGVLIGSLHVLDRETLASYSMRAFPVVLLGGLQSIPGALLGGMIIGVVEILSAGYLDPLVGGGAGDIMPYMVMLVVLIFLPYGMFGEKRIERV